MRSSRAATSSSGASTSWVIDIAFTLVTIVSDANTSPSRSAQLRGSTGVVSSSGSPARTCTWIVPSAATKAVASPPVGSAIQPTSPRAAASSTAASSQPAPRMAADVGGPTTSTSSTVTSGVTLAMASTIPGVRAARSRPVPSAFIPPAIGGRFGPLRTTSSRRAARAPGGRARRPVGGPPHRFRTRVFRRMPHRCPTATPAHHRAHTRMHRSRGRPVRSRWSGALRRSAPSGSSIGGG